MTTRIALIFEFGSLNGGEHSMLSAMDALAGSGSDLEFVALAPRMGRLQTELKGRGINCEPFDVRNTDGGRRPRDEILKELATILRRAQAQLAHANSLSMGRLTGRLASHLRIPCVAHLRDIIKLSNSSIHDLNQNQRLIAVSHATREFHVSRGLSPERVVAIHNGVDCKKFQPRRVDASLRDQLGIGPHDFVVLNVGQIGLRKGQDILAEAAVQLGDRVSPAHFLLAGERLSQKAESIAFEQKIIQRFQDIGRGNRFRLLGYVDDMPSMMNAADVLVHSAHQEPLGRVLLEAAASGLPIIATDVGGTAEILDPDHSAVLVPPSDPTAIASAIQRVFEAPAFREQIAKNARERMLQRFTIESAGRRLGAFWHEILSHHH